MDKNIRFLRFKYNIFIYYLWLNIGVMPVSIHR
jgi:hypothetical protein